ncbi:MAG: hypothetical protein COA42_06925 [Alteromonadaceae bacterium]|nr:MAG: hypothetical protein COA42_06925 [Alteromonadaceae bacterium]
MRPRRIDILPRDDLSYTVSRYDEDDDVRFGFGTCGKVERQHIDIVEAELAWLGVVFHIVVTSESDSLAMTQITMAKNDLAAVKDICKHLIIKHLKERPNKLRSVLEGVHEGSREQGYLEIIENALGSIDPTLNLQKERFN